MSTPTVSPHRNPLDRVAALDRLGSLLIGTDPGLSRLRGAVRTTAALACALGALYLLTAAAHQPVTVALLGVVIAMVSARAAGEPDPKRLKVTLTLLPLAAIPTIAVSAVLASHRLLSDAVFVLIVFVAVYIRRFGGRGTALGMVAFMTYFFTLFLRTTTAELPWLMVAVLVGSVCSFVTSVYLLPDRPEQMLRRTMRSTRARMARVVEAGGEAVRAARLDGRRRRRLGNRTARLNEAALMVATRLEDTVRPALPGADVSELALRLFDLELCVERVAGAAARAAVADLPATSRAALADALDELARGMRTPDNDGLTQAVRLAHGVDVARPVEAHRAARAVVVAAAAVTELRREMRRASSGAAPHPPAESAPAPEPDAALATDPAPRTLLPTTRQAVQVTIATSLAIVAGELVSPARWYWAVIATFVIFAGTSSWGETLTKGWQRLVGTLLGVPAGVVVATLVGGAPIPSLVLIFVCLFCAFYLMKVSYSLMVFWITAMLALLYGLLGEFTLDMLLLRIEETAIGAVIGVTVAILVLPNNTVTAARTDARAFLAALSDLIALSTQALVGAAPTAAPTAAARRLDRCLQQFRDTAKPLAAGAGGVTGRRSIQHVLRLFTACDHYARTLARCAEIHADGSAAGPRPAVADAISAAATATRADVDVLVAMLAKSPAEPSGRTTELLDVAGTMVGVDPGDAVAVAVHALRQLDRTVLDAADDLGRSVVRT